MIANFLEWIKYGNGVLTPVYPGCTAINNIWNTPSTTTNSPLFGIRPVAAMAAALSDNTRVAEFFILNSDINNVKQTVRVPSRVPRGACSDNRGELDLESKTGHGLDAKF